MCFKCLYVEVNLGVCDSEVVWFVVGICVIGYVSVLCWVVLFDVCVLGWCVLIDWVCDVLCMCIGEVFGIDVVYCGIVVVLVIGE